MSELLERESQVVIRPAGDLMASTVEGLKAQLMGSLEAGGSRIVIDLCCVQRIDAVALGVLVAAANRLGQSGGSLVISNASEAIARMLKVMRLDRVFRIED